MSLPEVIDIQARRKARPASAFTLVQDIDAAITTLHQDVASWPYVHLREGHLVGAERSLVEIQNLLVRLRQYVPATDPQPKGVA